MCTILEKKYTGYSFTEDNEGYSTTSEHAAEGIYQFLQQFFLLFPEISSNPFFIAGFSYGAHFIAPLTTLILEKNIDTSSDIKLNLKSILLFGPWIDPIRQVDFGSYLYNLGMLTETEKLHFDEENRKMVELMLEGKYADAKKVIILYLISTFYEAQFSSILI